MLHNAALQRALTASLRLSIQKLVKPQLSASTPVNRLRRLIDQSGRLSPAPTGVNASKRTLGGVACQQQSPTRLKSSDQQRSGTVLYLHGGAFMIGSPRSHRGLTAHLARSSGCHVVVPDYRLAPEHPYPAALEDAAAVYQALLASGLDASDISIAGDSAGGGLTLALAQYLQQQDLPLPKALVLISPWLDLTHAQIHSPAIEPMLQLDWIKSGAEVYRGNLALDDPRISPLLGQLAGLPPILVQVGTQEILLNDSRRLAKAVSAAGGQVTLREYEDLWHVFQLHAGLLTRADAALREISHFITT